MIMRKKSKIEKKACRLPISAIGFVIHKEKPGNYRIKWHSHGGHEIVYVDYGSVLLRTSKEDFHLRTGDCVIIPDNAQHKFSGYKGKPFNFLNIVLFGKLPENIANQVFHLSYNEHKIMMTLKKELQDHQLHYENIVLLKLNELILTLSRHSKELLQNNNMTGGNKVFHRNFLINNALLYLEKHHANAFELDAVAKHIGVSKSHLRNLVSQNTGKSMRQHLKQFRMEKAKILLRESPHNVDTIAYKVGYNSVPHFCTLFKNAYGMTPTEYAKSLGIPKE